MKTREELEVLALRISAVLDMENKSTAIQLLDSLHSEGMRDGGDIAEDVLERKENRYEYATNVSCKPREAIITAIANKQP